MVRNQQGQYFCFAHNASYSGSPVRGNCRKQLSNSNSLQVLSCPLTTVKTLRKISMDPLQLTLGRRDGEWWKMTCRLNWIQSLPAWWACKPVIGFRICQAALESCFFLCWFTSFSDTAGHHGLTGGCFSDLLHSCCHEACIILLESQKQLAGAQLKFYFRCTAD